MSRRLVLVWALVALCWGSPSRAQVPFPRDLVPKRESLSKLGLERMWMGVVPLTHDERVLTISMADTLVFIRTSLGMFHVYDAETGKLQWSLKLGNGSARGRPASVNKFAVCVSNLNFLHVIDRKTGRTIWTKDLGMAPATATACDDDRVMVGMPTGKLYAFDFWIKNAREGTKALSDHPIDAWNWQTAGVMETRPLPAGRLIIFGSDDGKTYVAFADERTMLYRILTGGPIGDGFGTHGTRRLLVPSADHNLYGVDVLTGTVAWTFASGAPIKQEPLVANNDVFVVNTAGQLSSIEAETDEEAEARTKTKNPSKPKEGTAHWTTSTFGGRLVSVGEKKVYLETQDGDLFMVDRKTGQMLVSPEASLNRVGLNLREYTLGLTNRQNDRIYLGTPSGMVIALREVGRTTPLALRDKNEKPFAYVPPQGIDLTPTPAPVTPGGVPTPAPAPVEGENVPAPAPATDEVK